MPGLWQTAALSAQQYLTTLLARDRGRDQSGDPGVIFKTHVHDIMLSWVCVYWVTCHSADLWVHHERDRKRQKAHGGHAYRQNISGLKASHTDAAVPFQWCGDSITASEQGGRTAQQQVTYCNESLKGETVEGLYLSVVSLIIEMSCLWMWLKKKWKRKKKKLYRSCKFCTRRNWLHTHLTEFVARGKKNNSRLNRKKTT